MMIGATPPARPEHDAAEPSEVVLSLNGVRAYDRTGLKTIAVDRLDVRAGEIVGIAGISGNGQMELMELLNGQRDRSAGSITVQGSPYCATRSQSKTLYVRSLPEEPLRNACVPNMSVAENLGFRTFDVNGGGTPRFWISNRGIRKHAAELVSGFKIKTTSLDSPIAALSGGNVQRTVLARELTGEVDLLVISNPCFGLDFSAVAEIRSRIISARNAGTAVLLMSEDLDEILELSDRILVMSEGRFTYETPAAGADIAEIGRHMAGHGR